MKILSIHYGHNASVAISIDGEMKCVLSEERICRIKNATGFPYEALKHIVETYLQGDIRQCDHLVINDELLMSYQYLEAYGLDPKPYAQTYYYLKRKGDFRKFSKFSLRRVLGLKKRKADPEMLDEKEQQHALEKLSRVVGLPAEKIVRLNHHKAHAYASNFFVEEVNARRLVFTLDGVGDNISGTVSIMQNGLLDTLSVIRPKASLGYLYGTVTGYLGMKPDEHEFKVMGLAPYAYPEHAERIAKYFHNILWLNDRLEFESSIDMTGSELRRYLMQHLFYERFDNIAGGLQLFSETII